MSSPSHPWIDASAAPLYALRFPNSFGDEEFKRYLEAWEMITLAQTKPYAVLCDARQVIGVSASQRHLQADSDARLASQDAKLCAGAALVCESAIMRGAFRAAFWLSPPVFPYQFFPTEQEGVAWLKQQLVSFKPKT